MHFQAASTLKNTYGLVVCGGQSSRMGTDKSMLTYFSKPQKYHVYDMLRDVCEKVFISCNESQGSSIGDEYNKIEDNTMFKNKGPVSALLTAFSTFPGKDILFIGCDYPYLAQRDLVAFVNQCSGDRGAAFYNSEEMYEPMLAWYPYRLSAKVMSSFADKQYSLQKLLNAQDAVKYCPADENCMKSIDNKEEYLKAFNDIRNKN